MRKFSAAIITTILAFTLAGCGDTFQDLKEAASGINSAADEAASAISQDVHSIRAIEITYNNHTFTVNDLFKSILRDVQWHYEENGASSVLKVTGTWLPNLFDSYSFSVDQQNALALDGHVTVYLTIDEGVILDDKTKVTLMQKEKLLVDEKGKEVLYHFYETYAN
ncbi:23S rRNA methyltransferase [Lysinibacillus sp. 54212]|uniref:23S rRNA methyltransferase n=1 Tax=Lysinibacillus sp. 54212 TaxID=3119829 RepID=UPI002FCB2230